MDVFLFPFLCSKVLDNKTVNVQSTDTHDTEMPGVVTQLGFKLALVY